MVTAAVAAFLEGDVKEYLASRLAEVPEEESDLYRRALQLVDVFSRKEEGQFPR